MNREFNAFRACVVRVSRGKRENYNLSLSLFLSFLPGTRVHNALRYLVAISDSLNVYERKIRGENPYLDDEMENWQMLPLTAIKRNAATRSQRVRETSSFGRDLARARQFESSRAMIRGIMKQRMGGMTSGSGDFSISSGDLSPCTGNYADHLCARTRSRSSVRKR